MLLSGRRSGSCLALRWQSDILLYRCGSITQPKELLAGLLPANLKWAAPLLAWVLERLARRWVAVGIGCDCDVHLDNSSKPV
jgi:hypothetical protein